MIDSLPDHSQLTHLLDSILRVQDVVLGPSQKQNLAPDQTKAVQYAYDLVIKDLNRADSGSNSTQIELTSKSFRLLHLYKQSDRLDTIKKHENFIVRLIEKKNIEKALEELATLSSSINNIVHGKKIGKLWASDSLLSAIPYTRIANDTNRPIITNLTVTYYFLAFQCFLQYITIHLKSIAQNSDSMLSLLSFHDIAFQSLSSSEFSKWLQNSSETLLMKYRKNQMKIIQGFLKILSFLASKIDSSSNNGIKVTHQLLKIKLTELHVLQNDPAVSLPEIEPNYATTLFLNDLKQSCESNSSYQHLILSINSLISHEKHCHTDEYINKLVYEFRELLENPCERTIKSVSSKLLLSGFPIQLWELTEFTSIMNSLNSCLLRSYGSLCELYLVLVATVIISNMKHLHTLSKDHLYYLDTLTIFMRDLISNNDNLSTSGTIDLVFTQLYSTVCSFNQEKRMRNLSNLYFNLAKKQQSLQLWEKCLRYENLIYVRNANDDNLKLADAKMAKVSQILLSIDRPHDVMTMLSNSLSEFNAVMENDVDIMKLEHLKFTRFVPMLVKNLLADSLSIEHLIGDNSVLNDALRSLVYLSLLDFIEKSNLEQKEQLINSATVSLSISTSRLQQLCYYSYLKTNGVNNYVNTEVPLVVESPIDHLYLCGIKLFETINNIRSEIGTCLGHLEKWCSSERGDGVYKLEQDIFKALVKYLEHIGSLGKVNHVMKLMELCKNNDPAFLQLQLYCNVICCELVIRGGFNDSAQNLLTTSGETLKSLSRYSDKNGKLKYVTSHQICEWKLLQLQFTLSQGDIPNAAKKLESLRTFVSSKPEFDLKHTSLSVVDRFLNLILMAKFQLLACKINFQVNHPIDSLGNCKLTIKLLYSVIKKLPTNIPKIDYNDLKWRTSYLLFESYKQIIQLYKHLGISRDIPYYIDEFTKVNDSSTGNYVHSVNCHLISRELLFLNNLEESLAASQNSKSALINDSNISLIKSQNEALYQALSSTGGNNIAIKGFMPPKENTDFNDIHLNIPLDIHSLGLDFDYTLSLTGANASSYFDYVTNDKRKQFLKAFLLMKATFSEKVQELETLIQSVSTSPICLPHQINIKVAPNSQLNKTAEELIKVKQNLFGLMNSESFNYLDVHQLRDFAKVITNCIQLLSIAADVKPSNFHSLLGLIYYLQDIPRLLSFSNEKLVSSMDRQKTNTFIPNSINETTSVHDIEASASLFMNELKNLPPQWSIVTIDLSQNSEDLILTKFNSTDSNTPNILKLTLDRFNHRHNQNSRCSFSEVQADLSSIIDRSCISTKSSTTSQIRTKEDRKRWWKLRFGLDMELKALLDTIEDQWMGAFTGIFNGPNNDQLELFSDFKHDFELLWSSILAPVLDTESLTFNDFIVKLFYQFEVSKELGATESPKLDDLIYFVIEQLSMKSPKISPDVIDIIKVRNSLIQIIENYSQTRMAISSTHKRTDEHIVLVVGPECNSIPWESLQCLRNKSVSRMPSIKELSKTLKCSSDTVIMNNDTKGKLLYLINPGGDLARTESKFSNLFHSNDKIDMGGIIGHKPNEEEILSELANSDLFVYLGHGGCEQYIKTSSLLKMSSTTSNKLPPSLLIGCSSGQLQLYGFLEPAGNVYNWLICGCPMVVANLWDVTDKDIDLFSHVVLDKWGVFANGSDSMSITQAVSLGRKECTLKYLNGSAPVVYGLPLYLEKQSS